MDNMNIKYTFTFDDGVELVFDVDLDRTFDPKATTQAPEWTRLSNNQCSNCPLKEADYPHCPAALDLDRVARDFQRMSGAKKVNVVVSTADRDYVKRTTLEEGVRSLMGLIMSTSACPVLGSLRSNARFHLPFLSQDEFISRAASIYLMRQYYVWKEGGTPDWDMKGLVRLNEQLQLVNHGFWQRVVAEFQNDSNSKALLSFFTMSSKVSSSFEAQLAKLKPIFFVGNGD